VACASRGEWDGVRRLNLLDAGDKDGDTRATFGALVRFLLRPLEGRRTWQRSSYAACDSRGYCPKMLNA
jgi:hypothetical protein